LADGFSRGIYYELHKPGLTYAFYHFGWLQKHKLTQVEKAIRYSLFALAVSAKTREYIK